ncbi:autolysin AtlA, partial [Lacticaseibacillus paracasei subsp. paracasei Lpp7]
RVSGVTGVVVKVTEASSYHNPFATSQIANARAAGLKVSAYHYGWMNSTTDARSEADILLIMQLQMALVVQIPWYLILKNQKSLGNQWIIPKICRHLLMK